MAASPASPAAIKIAPENIAESCKQLEKVAQNKIAENLRKRMLQRVSQDSAENSPEENIAESCRSARNLQTRKSQRVLRNSAENSPEENIAESSEAQEIFRRGYRRVLQKRKKSPRENIPRVLQKRREISTREYRR
ncbi:hypothetical protein V498_07334 [Pseudogymnoascus sp. VKM F-4517 (FW-2822)]|nr:hypothetical protein V498_07334 [Pseudogymnoascus sp. VKM F-4517 (FW-2822)]